MFRRIDRIILPVQALPGAVHYYRDVLGMKLVREDKQSAFFLMMDGKTEMVLSTESDLGGEEICYLVDDVRDLYERREELQLKFVQMPRETGAGWSAVIRDPFGNVMMILDRVEEAEDGTLSSGMLFSGVEADVPAKREVLSKIYEEVGRTADDLPYTPDFEKLFDRYAGEHPEPKPTRREVWRHLLNLRKAGKLPKLGEARSPSPEVTAEQEQTIRELLGEDIGKRDRLPYTERFDRLVDDFNKTQGRPLSPHLVWRLVAKLAK
jgi:catechol 2,3-dioxygenase-like lactoylglutathione lyase family enzyme